MSRIYHKKEIEIAGEKITTEYFEVHFAEPCSDNKYSLSDLWDTITYPFYIIKCRYRSTRIKIRYCLQRMKHDYDNIDMYALCDKFIKRYSKILKAYKENLHGHPCHMTSEEWDEILDQLLFHLHYMDEDNVDNEIYKDIPHNWIPTSETSMKVYQIMNKHKNEFFKLFSEYFYDLWD